MTVLPYPKDEILPTALVQGVSQLYSNLSRCGLLAMYLY